MSRKNLVHTKAFSAGLRVGEYKTRKVYAPALQYLEKLKIKPSRADDLSIHVDDLDLDKFNIIICLDRDEHKPMIEANKKFCDYSVEYWDITDEPMMSYKISLPKCYDRVEKLFIKVANSN